MTNEDNKFPRSSAVVFILRQNSIDKFTTEQTKYMGDQKNIDRQAVVMNRHGK
jgi:hypothetical protein